MEALLHLIFTLIKISILSCIYAAIILVVFRIIGSYKPNSWFNRVSKKKLRLWFRCGFIISVSLFIFTFTYFGNHGLGDSARVPVGHWKAVKEINGTQAYIQDEGPVSAIEIDRFLVTDNFVYGIASDSNENYEGKFFVYDLANNIVTTFTNVKEYVNFLKTNNLKNNDYKDFRYYYSQYWHGLRFWLLP